MIRTFIDSDMFLLTLTVGLYCGGVALHHRLRLAILHPTLLAFVALILFLKVCGIDYGHYRQATEILDFLLGMSVVALGWFPPAPLRRISQGPRSASTCSWQAITAALSSTLHS